VDDLQRVLEQRREHYAQGRLLETWEDRVQINAHRHEIRTRKSELSAP